MESNRQRIVSILVDQTIEEVIAALLDIRVDSPYELSVKKFAIGFPYAKITFLRLGNVGYAEMIIRRSKSRPTTIEVYLKDEKWETLEPLWLAIEDSLIIKDAPPQPNLAHPNVVSGIDQHAPMPLLEGRAKPQEWYTWFDWYYEQAWGVVTNKIKHMSKLSGKGESSVQKMHAQYMADKRN